MKTTSSVMLEKRGAIAVPVLFASLALMLSGCAAIEGIFKAGLWVGIIAVVVVVAVVGGAVALLRR